MEDFRNITMVNRNINFENTLAENHLIKSKNDVLVLVGVLAGCVIVGMAIYYANREYNRAKKYNTARN